MQGYEFLEEFALGKKLPIGKRVVVVGAGNVAIDAARSCLRLGADVTVVYRRDRDEMPANEHEIKDAMDENIRFMFMSAPHRIIGDVKGRVTGLEVRKMRFDGLDATGRKRPDRDRRDGDRRMLHHHSGHRREGGLRTGQGDRSRVPEERRHSGASSRTTRRTCRRSMPAAMP